MERFQEEIAEYDLEEDAAAEECTDEQCALPAHGHAQHDAPHGHDQHAAPAAAAADHAHAPAAHEHGHAPRPAAPAHEHGHAGGLGGEREGAREGAREGQKAKKRKHDISGVGSFALQSEHALDSQLFNRFMVQLLQRKKEDLYRSKGVLCFEGEGDAKYIFQGVHEQIQFEQSNTKWVEGEPRVSKVVFIGRDLDREEIEAAFRTCIVHAQTAHPH